MKKILIPLIFSIAACHTAIKKTDTPAPPPPAETCSCQPCPKIEEVKPAAALVKIDISQFPFFKDDGDKKDFLKAAELNMKFLEKSLSKNSSYLFGDRKISYELLLKTNKEFNALLSSQSSWEELNKKIAEKFDVYELKPSTKEIIFSSYYEPIIEASLNKTAEYKYPIYSKPSDLISVNLEDFNEKFKGEKITGRIENQNLIPYYSREEIDYKEAIKGKVKPLAWFKSAADVMDLHIQGSGILKLPDGKYMKAKFAATNSLKFKGWMTALLEMKLMTRAELNADSAKKFLDSNPKLEREILSQNKRYTFFKLEDNADLSVGPEGTYGYPLVGQRSIAIDNSIIPFGTLAFMKTSLPDVDNQGNYFGKKEDSRFVFAHDTGGAIKNARVDFFAGNGPRAKKFAFSLWDPGKLYFIVLKEEIK
ncbi:MAG: MltA domain-containing protein [Elusimicrobiota bacterium]